MNLFQNVKKWVIQFCLGIIKVMTPKQAIHRGIIWQTPDKTWHKCCPNCNQIQNYVDSSFQPLTITRKIHIICLSCTRMGHKPTCTKENRQPCASTEPPIVETKNIVGSTYELVYSYSNYGHADATITFYDVSLECECGWKQHRGIPGTPCRLKWFCHKCDQPYVTNFI